MKQALPLLGLCAVTCLYRVWQAGKIQHRWAYAGTAASIGQRG